MDLSGKFLIAMPGMGDPRFEKAVLFMCRHSSEGAMGLIVNKPLVDITFAQMLRQLEIPLDDRAGPVPVAFGGPVETGRGFVLHSDDYAGEGTLVLPHGLALTATRDVIRALASGDGPRRAMLALGYAGWAAGQVEGELARNDWLTADGDADLVFASDPSRAWAGALALLGISPLSLSHQGGRA